MNPLLLAGLMAAAAGQPAEPAVVWAAGDGGDGTPAARRMARRIAADRPERFLYLGDVYDHGTAEEFRRNYEPTYGRLAAITEPTPGNHEWVNRNSGYYPYWKRKKERRLRAWYSFELGGWQVLNLNSLAAHGPGSSQLRWLRRATREPGTCRLAFFHHPRFSRGLHGGSRDVQPLWSALRGRARLVLSGHDHNSQRFRQRNGLTQLVAGAGGATLYRLRPSSRLAFGRSDRTAAVRLELEAGRARIEFRDSSGRVLDRSTARCDSR